MEAITYFGLPSLYTNNAQAISDVVRRVFQDSNGNFWFGTQNGAFRFDGKSLQHLDDIKSQTGKGVTIKDIAEDTNGNIWFGHSDGISKYKDGLVTNYFERDGLIDNDVWCIATDRNNKVWIGTIQGACYFDGGVFTPFAIPEGKPDPSKGVSSSKMIHSISEDSRGRMWFGTNGGAYTYDGSILTNISERDGLRSNFVNEILEDRVGNFWISTESGLYYLKENNLKENKLVDVTSDIINRGKSIGSVIQDANGNIWFCSNLRDLYQYDGQEFKHYRFHPGDFGPATFQVYEDHDDRLWFVGFGGAFRYDNNKIVNVTRNGPW